MQTAIGTTRLKAFAVSLVHSFSKTEISPGACKVFKRSKFQTYTPQEEREKAMVVMEANALKKYADHDLELGELID